MWPIACRRKSHGIRKACVPRMLPRRTNTSSTIIGRAGIYDSNAPGRTRSTVSLTISAAMKKYNVGIIGYGWVAGAHIGAINGTSRAQVTKVYSSRKLDSAELSARHGGQITASTNLDAFLAD